MKRVTIGAKPTSGFAGGPADAWVHDRQLPQEPTKRLTVDLPSSLHRRIKCECALREENMADVLREILEQHFPAEYAEARGGTSVPVEAGNPTL